MKKTALSHLFNSSPIDRAFIHMASTDADIRVALMPFLKEAAKWNKLPNGWTQESVKKFWDSLTGEVKHKVTKCMKEMEGKVDNTGAFCGSLADVVDPGWRSRRAADLDKEFTGVGALADSAFKMVFRGVGTRVFGDSLEIAIAEVTMQIWNMPQAPQIRDMSLFAGVKNIYKSLNLIGSTQSTRPSTEWGLSELDPVRLERVTELYAKKLSDKLQAAVFCLILLKKAKMLQAKSKVETLFKKDLVQEISQARHLKELKAPAKAKTVKDYITPEIQAMADKTFTALGRDPQKALDIAGSIAENINWHSAPLVAVRPPADPQERDLWDNIVYSASHKLDYAVEPTAAFIVTLLQLAGKRSEAREVMQAADEEIKRFSRTAKNREDDPLQWRPYTGRPLVLTPKEVQRSDGGWAVVTRPQPDGKWMVAVVRVQGGNKGYPWGSVVYVSEKKFIEKAIGEQLRILNKLGLGGDMADASRSRKFAGR